MALGYWRGETVPFHRVWTTDSGNDATGTTVVLTLGGPLGAIVIPTVAGIDGPTITVDAEYAIPDDAGSVGLWSARWELAGTIVEAAEDVFYVKRSLTNANDPGSGLIGTPALQLLAALLTVDGAGSLLDADTVDGLHAAAFATPASTTAAVAAHAAATDPHADRAFATAAIATAITNLVNAAPGTLDTLNELALALGSDPNFATTMATALANKQPLDADLTAIAALVSAANKIAYATGAGTWALTDYTAAARTFDAAIDAAAERTVLGLGTAATTAATAYATAAQGATADAAQPGDSELTALASTTSAANKLPYFTGSGTATTTDLTAAGRALIDDADASAQRTTLGLGTAATTAATDYATAAQGATADLAIPKATLTANGDILTRAAGVPALITRANLAADAAFTAAYATLAHGTDQPITEYTGTSVPSTPGTGVTMFARRRPSAGRRGFAYVTANGAVIEGQPHIGTSNWMAQRPAPNISGIVSLGPVVSAIGTATAATVASATTDIAGLARTSYVSAASAGSSGGLRSTSNYLQRSNGSGRGGFYMICRFAFASIPATRRWFVGISPSSSNTEPSSWLNMFGVGQDLGDTSPQFMTNDGSGTATKTSSTLADVAINLVYEVRLLSAPNLSTVQMSIERFAAGASAEYAEYDSGVSTDLPAQVTVAQWVFWANNGSTAAIIDPLLIDLYFEQY